MTLGSMLHSLDAWRREKKLERQKARKHHSRQFVRYWIEICEWHGF